MKETIYTIPVNKAFAECGRGDCAFCVMMKKLNENSIEFVMGPSYMEDDVRMETNKTGFCAKHMEEMYRRPNRLGLALMTHTHLMKVNADLKASLAGIAHGGRRPAFGGANKHRRAEGAAEYLRKIERSCYICARTDETFIRYVDTFFHLWKSGAEFKTLTESGGGFCLSHFRLLLERGEEKLSAHEYDEFLKAVVPLQQRELKKLEDDLEWFTRKFDYRNVNEPWKDSKDALIRSLKKISSVAEVE